MLYILKSCLKSWPAVNAIEVKETPPPAELQYVIQSV